MGLISYYSLISFIRRFGFMLNSCVYFRFVDFRVFIFCSVGWTIFFFCVGTIRFFIVGNSYNEVVNLVKVRV